MFSYIRKAVAQTLDDNNCEPKELYPSILSISACQRHHRWDLEYWSLRCRVSVFSLDAQNKSIHTAYIYEPHSTKMLLDDFILFHQSG